jgi:uncharacterized protein
MIDNTFDEKKLVDICRQNDISRLSVFGSTARGEAAALSDIDLLVEFSKAKSLLAVVKLESELSAALGRKVDLLTRQSISPYILKSIMPEIRVIYDA